MVLPILLGAVGAIDFGPQSFTALVESKWASRAIATDPTILKYKRLSEIMWSGMGVLGVTLSVNLMPNT